MRWVGRDFVAVELLIFVAFRCGGHADRSLDAVRPHARKSGAVKRPKAPAVMGCPRLSSGAGSPFGFDCAARACRTTHSSEASAWLLRCRKGTEQNNCQPFALT